MKKRIFLLFIASIIGLNIIGCNNSKNEVKGGNEVSSKTQEQNSNISKENDQSKEKKEPIEALKQAFLDNGFEVGENQPIAYEMLGATSGEKFTLDGELIEIYYYDELKLNDESRKLYEQAKLGNVDMSGINIHVIFKNNFALCRAEEHKEKDKILEVFNSFEY